MENCLTKRTLNGRVPIILFSIFALVGTMLSNLSYFFYYRSVYSYEYNYYYDTYESNFSHYALDFIFPSLLSWVMIFFSLIPFIFFMLYALVLNKCLKPRIALGIMFCTFVLIDIITVLSYGMGSYLILSVLTSFFIYLPVAIILFIGVSRKVFPLIAIISNSLLLLFNFVRFLSYIRFYFINHPLYIFTSLMSNLGFTFLLVGLLILVLTNKLSDVSAKQIESQSVSELPPTEALKLLKQKLELNLITEEEYNALRTQIISQL